MNQKWMPDEPAGVSGGLGEQLKYCVLIIVKQLSS